MFNCSAPFVEGGESFLHVHLGGAVRDARVGALARVHVSRFDDVHRRRDHCGDEAGSERRRGMARQGVTSRDDAQRQQALLDQVVRDQLARVHDCCSRYVRART